MTQTTKVRITGTPEQQAEFLRLIGDPQEVADDLRRFEERTLRFIADWPRLIARYPEKWVAEVNGEYRAADTVAELRASLAADGIPWKDAFVEFVTCKHVDLVM